MENRSIVFYIMNRLSLLSDEEVRNLDFNQGLTAIEKTSDISSEDKKHITELFSLIEKEIVLSHHGIKGQRWGVRRYQNKDGSLTEAGKKKIAEDRAKNSIFGMAVQFNIQTKSGEVLTAEPVKPWSTGKKIINALMGVSEKDELGHRGDANYVLKNSKGDSIGELSLINKNPSTAYLDWITIDNSNRGKGYATDIINTLIDSAKNTGYQKLELNALKKPRALYERIGFSYSDRSKVNIISRINSFELGCKHMEYDLTKNSALSHHGIKGQRWGVRRYQNEDGSLTAAGKKKYAMKGFAEDSLNSNKTKLGRAYDRLTDAHKYGGEMIYNLSSQKERDRRAEQYVKEHNIGKKDVKTERKEASKNRRNLSDAELKKRIERIELERKMKDLTEKDISPGKAFVSEVLSNSGKRVATTVVTGATLYMIKASLEGNINLKDAAQYVAPRPKNK